MRSLPGLRARTRSSANSCGVSCTGSPPHRDGSLLEVDPQVAELDDRLGGSVGAPQRGAQAREQLLDAERLRHVVVGARVERRDLLGLVADDGEDDHRRAAPGAQLARDVGAAAVGQHEVEHDGVGRVRGERGRAPPRPCRRSRRRSRRRAGSSAARAGSAARRRRRGRAAAHARTAAGAPRAAARGRGGRPRGRPAPRAGRRSPRRSRARSTRPRPEPTWPALPRRNGWKSASRSSAGRPGPRSTTWRRSSVAPDSARTTTPRARRRVVERVVDQVREHPLDLRGVDLDRRRLRPDLEPHAGGIRAEPGERLARRARPRATARGAARRRRPRAARGRAAARRRGRAARPRRGSSRRARAGRRASSESPGLASASADARIAVSGERRSCETARSSAVLRASLRRSASASSASASSRCARRPPRAARRATAGSGVRDGLVDRRLLVEEERRDAAQPRLDGQAPALPRRGGCSPSSSRAPSTPSTPAVSAASRPSSSSRVAAAQQVERRLGQRVRLGAAAAPRRPAARGLARPAHSRRRRSRGRPRARASSGSPAGGTCGTAAGRTS